jgi:phage gpG-like protein
MGGVVGDFGKARKLGAQFRQLSTPSKKQAFVANLAEEYRDFMMDCFQQSRSPYGEKWAPLKFRSSANGRGQKPLMNSGLMRAAATPIAVTAAGWKVSVGRIYATTHQHGAVIVPKRKKVLRWAGASFTQVGKGTRGQHAKRSASGFVFARRVVIPARPFAPLNGMPPELDMRARAAADDFMRAHFGG